jgi:hypothetical protein
MHKRTTGLILAGVLATGAVGAVAMTPASATTSANPVSSRLAQLKSALSGLVGDGTLTQAQADKVAGTLDSKMPRRGEGAERGMRGPGGHFGRMGMKDIQAAAAKALGLTPAQLHASMESGKSLADVAKAQKVSVGVLVKAMVTAAEADLATAVKDGRLTQAQADTMKSSLTKRITDQVNRVRPDGPRGMMPGGGMGPGPAGADGVPPGGSTPGGTPSAPSAAPSSLT